MKQLNVEPAEFIYFDLFPSTVTKIGSNEPYGDSFRTIVTNDYLYVIVETGYGPDLLIKEPLVSIEGSHSAGFQVNDYTITRSINCGCGTTLRGIYPFMGVPFRSQLDGPRKQ